MSIFQVKEKYKLTLKKKANVHTVMVSYKIIDGKMTNIPSITCIVEEKLPEEKLRKRDLIPKKIGGFKTDVIQSPRFKVRAINKTTKIRPCPMGTSGGHYKITAGTNGELLIDRKTGKVCIGTNNHVAANSNDAKIGDPYFQPGPYDGGKSSDKIGSLLKFIPIKFQSNSPEPDGCKLAKIIGCLYTLPFNLIAKTLGRKSRLVHAVISQETNLVDAAMVLVDNQVDVLAEILGIGRPKGTGDPVLGEKVQKSGRTTCHTTNGLVVGIEATLDVEYAEGKIAIFEEQIIIEGEGFSAGGDSGSLVLNMDGVAKGKLFAGGGNYTVANKISHYLNLLEATLW